MRRRPRPHRRRATTPSLRGIADDQATTSPAEPLLTKEPEHSGTDHGTSAAANLALLIELLKESLMPVLNRRHVAIVVTLSILGVASAAISTARAHGASTATSVPLIWTPAKAELALTAALNIHAKDSSGAGIYDFRVQTIRQFKPVNVYFRGKIYKRGAFVVIVDAVPVHGNFQYGTLTSFCFRPASGVLPYHWVITGFDTLQTAINGAPPYGCRTTPEAMRAAGVRTR